MMRFNGIMTFEQTDVLAGRAKSTSAQFYVAYEVDKMSEKYRKRGNDLDSIQTTRRTLTLYPDSPQ